MNKVLEVTQDELNTLVQAEVEKHLSSKEEAEARREAEEALSEAKETFEQLKAALEARDAKIAEYEQALANLDTTAPSDAEVAANDKIVELEGQIEELTQRATVAEAALETLAREETAASRMSELEEAGVALEGDEAEKQYAKVRDMDDDSFESYKSELVALKSKYASTSEEDGDEAEEVAELSADEVNMIAQSLGCDPQDSKCISLVQEVAEKMSEVSRNRKKMKKDMDSKENCEEDSDSAPEGEGEAASEEGVEEPKKETASRKTLSLGEAITKSMDQEIQASAGLREELAQAWEERYAERRGENNKSE